jgi:hypothetical protein
VCVGAVFNTFAIWYVVCCVFMLLSVGGEWVVGKGVVGIDFVYCLKYGIVRVCFYVCVIHI